MAPRCPMLAATRYGPQRTAQGRPDAHEVLRLRRPDRRPRPDRARRRVRRARQGRPRLELARVVGAQLRRRLRGGGRPALRRRGAAGRDRRGDHPPGDPGPAGGLAALLRPRRVRRQPGLGVVRLPRAARAGAARGTRAPLARHPRHHPQAPRARHHHRVPRVRRRAPGGLGERLAARRLRPAPATSTPAARRPRPSSACRASSWRPPTGGTGSRPRSSTG